MPPGVNKLYIPVRTKTGAEIRKSKICREWADYAINQIKYQRSGLTIPYRFKVALWLPEARTDSDAAIKETLDACQHGGAIVNDAYCRGGTWEVDETRQNKSMLVELYELQDKIPLHIKRKISQERDQMIFGL